MALTLEPLLLASASPRRRELIAMLRLPFEWVSVDADETWRAGESVDSYLERVVEAKRALAAPIAEARGYRIVVVADTTVVLDGRLLSKPASEEENAGMIASLSGRTHEVKTRFAVAIRDGACAAQTVSTAVTFRALSGAEVRGYAATGEGRDKAGGYAIQGLGSFAVETITGSYTNVVGLPTCELITTMTSLGLLAGFPG